MHGRWCTIGLLLAVWSWLSVLGLLTVGGLLIVRAVVLGTCEQRLVSGAVKAEQNTIMPLSAALGIKDRTFDLLLFLFVIFLLVVIIADKIFELVDHFLEERHGCWYVVPKIVGLSRIE